MYRSANDVAQADWVVAGVRGFAESVLSLVPAGFPAYVRVFHPMRIDQSRMSWAEIAHTHGKRVHPGMQAHAIGAPDQAALETAGQLDRDVAASLVRVLAHHTSTPDSCWFAVWEGFGGLPRTVADAPAFLLPNRRYHLLTSPIDAALDDALDRPFGYRSPNLWWPDDKAWLVATEIDLHSTYVGCTDACSADVLATSEIEALEVSPDTGITFDSDLLN